SKESSVKPQVELGDEGERFGSDSDDDLFVKSKADHAKSERGIKSEPNAIKSELGVIKSEPSIKLERGVVKSELDIVKSEPGVVTRAKAKKEAATKVARGSKRRAHSEAAQTKR
ncbi:a6c11b70-43ca-479b-873d-6a0051e5f3ba, partial [Thermothielavioides terrestris]